MKSTTVVALSALLSTGALAAPRHAHHAGRHAEFHLNKRDIVWITEFEVETVTVLRTVYGDGSKPTVSPNYPTGGETPSPVTFTSYAVTSTARATTQQTTTAPAYTPPATTSQAPAPPPVQSSSSAPAPVKSSTYVPPPAPQPTTSAYQAPAPAPSSSSAVAPAPSPTGSYGDGGSCSGSGATTSGTCYSGDFTYYAVGEGACGGWPTADGPPATDNDPVVAISHILFDAASVGANSNNNPLCGRKITLHGLDGSTQTVTVQDRCVGCAIADLDLPEPMFNAVTNNGDGRVHNMKWTWN